MSIYILQLEVSDIVNFYNKKGCDFCYEKKGLTLEREPKFIYFE